MPERLLLHIRISLRPDTTQQQTTTEDNRRKITIPPTRQFATITNRSSTVKVEMNVGKVPFNILLSRFKVLVMQTRHVHVAMTCMNRMVLTHSMLATTKGPGGEKSLTQDSASCSETALETCHSVGYCSGPALCESRYTDTQTHRHTDTQTSRYTSIWLSFATAAIAGAWT
jgi:hypothetical protein